MSLADFLAPVGQHLVDEYAEANAQIMGQKLRIHLELEGLPDLEGCQAAIIGVREDRGSENKGAAHAPEQIRHYLYGLYWGQWHGAVADLGDIYAGERLADTHIALSEVCGELLKRQIIPIVIGGSQDLTYGAYRAYDRLEQTVNMVAIDARFDLGQQNESLNHQSFLSHVILKKPYILFNYCNLGYQTYFVNQEEIDLMERMFFDVHRLGHLRGQIAEAEPMLRDADLVSFDLSAVRQSDAPANAQHSPNGFSGEEACALSRYAGISDKVSSFGIYECNPQFSDDGRTSHLAAQMIWYFLEGLYHRKGDYPLATKDDYEKFIVLVDDGEHELTFYKSPFSGRWWIEVPLKQDGKLSHERHQLIPCSYRDYEEAVRNEIPDRWWRAMKKGI